MRLPILLSSILALLSPAHAAEPIAPLTRAEREACRLDVEQFFAAERAAAAPEGSLRAAAPEPAQIARLVDDELRMESALASLYGMQIDATALQAELDRIHRDTQAPDQLARLYAALGNDARLAAECVARPGLVERLLSRRHRQADPGNADFAAWWHAARADHAPVEPAVLDRALVLRDLPDSMRRTTKSGTTGVETWQVDADDRGVAVPRGAALTAWNGSELFVFGGRDPLGGVLGTGGIYTPAIDHWRQVTLQAAPSPRHSGVAVWTGSRFLVMGGTNDRTGGLYDPVNDVWTPTSTNGAPVAGLYVTGVWTGTELLLFGGENSLHARYSPATDSWGLLPPSGLPPLIPVSAWLNGRMYVWGLATSNGGATLTSTLGAFDVASNQWITLSQAGAPSARFETAMTVVDGRIMIFGGSTGFGTLFNDGALYDPATNSWTPLPTNGAPSARHYHTLVSTGGQAIVFGGDTAEGVTNTGARYDRASNTWLPLASGNAPSARREHAAVWTGSAMVVLGGCVNAGNCSRRDGGRYSPAANQWTSIVPGDDYGRVAGAAAVWTGAEALLFGGQSSVTLLPQRGVSWRAATDTFSELPLAASPSARLGATAVWTGAQMLVWGGEDLIDGSLGDGARFDPATRLWSPISAVGAPEARSRHVMVWAGQRAIVFGGVSFNDALRGDGAGYNPQTDTWTALPASGAPTPRIDATAVSTGTGVVIWGGSSGGTPLGSGARFDAQAWTWVGPTAPGPSGRIGHTAIWTGSEMLVWGGLPVAAPSLARYNPVSNQWQAGPFTEPQSRVGHTAVWTGSELIIWGGARDGALQTGGGRYDPQANLWRDVASIGGPLPRLGHVALWTGSAMLVIGGNLQQQRRSLYYPNGLPNLIFVNGFEP
jgi:N-acetylneuraminic acid mutarotase